MFRIIRAVTGSALVLAVVAACVTIVETGSVEMVAPDDAQVPGNVESPMKAFLIDGSTIVYPTGARISADSIHGAGTRYALGGTDSVGVTAVSLDSLAGIEAFQGRQNVAGTVAATLGLTALAVVGGSALAVAIFGSCPTFYASEEQGGALQSEAFSYSIAPLLEGRDLDATSLRPDADGVLRVELRNEALETHYINHLELLAVDHEGDSRVVPDLDGLPVALRAETAPVSVVDRDGRDVRRALLAVDDERFVSSESRIRSASDADPDDVIELVFPRPEGDEAILQVRIRNSLLNTVLFYDMMLAEAGAEAVDWIGRDMARIGEVVELGRWFQRTMGLRIEVKDGDQWVSVGRITDTGPIAWEAVGVRVPLPQEDEVRVRLRFLVDAWRIDEVTLGTEAEIVASTRVPVARMTQSGTPVANEILEQIASPDDSYLATYPATTAALEFDPPPSSGRGERSYLLSSQGYYTEWVRPEWIRGTVTPSRFEPGDGTIRELMTLWLQQKDGFEEQFYGSRIPVR
jgi:hypothetical protein